MKINLTVSRTIFAGSLMLIPLMLPGFSWAASEVIGKTEPAAFQHSLKQIATDSVEDSLKACLARIPSDASAGQKTLAVDTCKEEDALRNMTTLTF